jgi:hypothetical protein
MITARACVSVSLWVLALGVCSAIRVMAHTTVEEDGMGGALYFLGISDLVSVLITSTLLVGPPDTCGHRVPE